MKGETLRRPRFWEIVLQYAGSWITAFLGLLFFRWGGVFAAWDLPTPTTKQMVGIAFIGMMVAWRSSSVRSDHAG